MKLFTIGHSNHTIESFFSLLKQHGITALADVRSQPYSRFLPQYNRETLQNFLEKQGIRYVFLGQELGARPANRDCYVDGKAIYEKIADTDLFKQGIDRLQKGLQKHKVTLLCAEKDPLTCHRAILICKNLRHFPIIINHIHSNGALESHEELEERMLIKHGFTNFLETQLSIFDTSDLPTRAECLEKSYQLQGKEIAYIEKGVEENDLSNQPIYNRLHPEERATVL